MSSKPTKTLELQRLLCPLPVIRTQQAIKNLAHGDTVEVICTDPGTEHDIPTWCRMYGHEVLAIDKQDGEITFTIKVINTDTSADNSPIEKWD